MYTVHVVPLLLYIIEGHTVSIFEEELTSAGKEDGVTGRSLDLLGHLILEVLDHQLHVYTCTGVEERKKP